MSSKCVPIRIIHHLDRDAAESLSKLHLTKKRTEKNSDAVNVHYESQCTRTHTYRGMFRTAWFIATPATDMTAKCLSLVKFSGEPQSNMAPVEQPHHMAYLLVHCRAVSMAWTSLTFHCSATSLARGSSGLGALSNA